MAQPYIFILGTGHSGGTLLNLMLGASPAVFAAGESLHLWNLATLEREDEATRAFWTQALTRLEAVGWPAERLNRNDVLNADPVLWRHWIKTVAAISPGPVVADKSNYLRVVRVLCDAGLVKPFFVHLVRDPRAVAYSYARKGRGTLARKRSWQASNAGISEFLDGRADAMVLRYEDLVSDPWFHAFQILERAGRHFGHDLCAAIRPDIRECSLGDPVFDNVIYGGNRMRRPANRAGQMIEPDMAYLQAASAFDWATTTTLCWPGLRRFGYPVTRKAMEKVFSRS